MTYIITLRAHSITMKAHVIDSYNGIMTISERCMTAQPDYTLYDMHSLMHDIYSSLVRYIQLSYCGRNGMSSQGFLLARAW